MDLAPHPGDDKPTFRGPEVARAAGLTYRMVDYWCRTGVLVPAVEANGSGTQRQFDAREVWIAAVLVALRALGADMAVLRRLGAQLRMEHDDLARGVVYVDAEGWMSHAPVPACWRLDLDSIAALVPQGA